MTDICRRLFPWHSLISTIDHSWDIAKILRTCYFGPFGMTGHPYQNGYYQMGKFNVTCMQKNKLYPSPLSWDMAKILQTCYFCNLSMPGCRKFNVYFHVKNQIYPSPFWNVAKTLQTCYLTYFGHAWPHPPKTLVSTCRKC